MLFADIIKAIGGADPIPATNHDVLWNNLITTAGGVILAVISLITLWLQYRNKVTLSANYINLKQGQEDQKTALKANTDLTMQGANDTKILLVDQKKALIPAVEKLQDVIKAQTEDIKDTINEATK
jgi:hypothetical protein